MSKKEAYSSFLVITFVWYFDFYNSLHMNYADSCQLVY